MVETDTKSQILSAALDLFARYGYEKTTMRTIAKKVGIQSASIYYFFDSKETLLKTLFSEFESNFAKYRNSPEDIIKAAQEKPLPEVLSMLFYTFGNPDEIARMTAISRVVLSLQYENTDAHKLIERIMVQEPIDYGALILKDLHTLGIIREIDFRWTSYIFRSFAVAIFEDKLRHLKPDLEDSNEFKEGIRNLCEAFASILEP